MKTKHLIIFRNIFLILFITVISLFFLHVAKNVKSNRSWNFETTKQQKQQ